ncbi:hypothetical protein ACFPM3_20225 [Streptomyces coeruleoprunus]|uniref:Uncharacterized protein n=1 Tax=Streptomyces coeruleoprunus TaxID=285563 RepID=A0ABV9XHI9_9ACTN
MSTPAQYIPADFQNELDLPVPGQVNQGEVNKRQADVYRHQKIARDTEMEIRNLELQLKTGKMSAAMRTRVQARLSRARKRLETANIDAGRAQNLVYQARGEYDKLLEGDNRDAFMALQAMFSQFGLGSLAGKIYDFVKQGYGADTIALLLQDTKEYKVRFAANEARAKAGLAVLSPAEYLAAESAYRQVLDSAGMPKGFYDNPADFQKWIAGDVSPSEIKSRVDLATEAVGKVDPNYRGALFQMYGIGESEMAAYFLDRKRAEPVLKKQAAAAAIGAAALRRGFAASRLDLEGYADLGITSQEAEAAYARISDNFEAMLGIAGRYGTTWTQREAEQEVFTPGAAPAFGAENAFEKSKRLRSQERALFSGGRGATSQGLSAGYRQT